MSSTKPRLTPEDEMSLLMVVVVCLLVFGLVAVIAGVSR